MKKNFLLLLLIAVISLFLAGTGILFAGFSRADAGTSTAQFLKLGAGARAAGMGETQTAVSDDANAVYWNPAGLAQIEGKSFSLMHVSWMDDTYYDWFSYAYNYGKYGTLGFGVQYVCYGKIEGTDDIGAPTGAFYPSDVAGNVSYGINIKNFLFGLNAKYISSKIVETGDTTAVDLGTIYKPIKDKLFLGAVLQNIGNGIKGVNRISPLPFTIKLGSAYNIIDTWLIALDVSFPCDNDPNFSAGTEYKQRYLTWRLGYNSRTKEIGGIAGLGCGVGFSYENFEIDYAYQPFEYMGDTHKISITWNSFGAVKKETLGGITFKPESDIFGPYKNNVKQNLVFYRVENYPRKAKSWKFEIFDRNHELVKRFSGEGKIPEIITWELDSDVHKEVSDGEYEAVSSMEGSLFVNPSQRSVSFYIDSKPPDIEVTVSKTLLSSNETLEGKPIIVSVNLKDKTGLEKWKIELINLKGNIIKNIEYTGIQSGAEINLNQFIPNLEKTKEKYFIKITAWDRIGNSGSTSIIIDFPNIIIEKNKR